MQMAGTMICLLVVAGSLLGLLWLSAKNREKNKKDAAKVLALTGFLGLVISITENTGQQMIQEGKLPKNEAGEKTQTQELQLSADGILEDYAYIVEVEAQRLQGAKMNQLFTDAAKEAEQIFIGESKSLDRIERDVILPKKLQDGQIRASWQFEPEGIIDLEGKLHTEESDKAGTLVMVSVTMSYYDEVRNHSFGCMVYPKNLSRVEKLLADLADYFTQEQEESKNQEYIRLPLKLNGNQLRWSQKTENTYRIILMIGLAAAVVVYIQQGILEQRKEQERKNKLLKQYPDMVSKISLLLGAGMTLSGAWERIVLNYQHQLEKNQIEQNEVYEQMMTAYREMQDGVGEIKVYERFAERCGTPQYRKFSMLIVQNLRKGSAGLRQILDKEVEDAFALRKNLAKKAGEEAGTKMLFPMMMMLCIVMVIILVPAFLTFRI